MIKSFLKKCFYVPAKVIIKSIDAVFALVTGTHVSGTVRLVCQTLETEKLYAAYQIMPKDTSEIPVLEGLDQSRSFAIVMQGPVCNKDNMTLNSIRFYQKVYPYARIIVSTWNDEPKEDIEKIAQLGATVVQSEKPSVSGILNVNYQLVNSLAGVKKAKELGCEFAAKTRTDQRICKPFIFDTMISAVKLFPGGKGQKGRLVTLGVCNGGMFTPYYTCDFLYLGYTDDLINLFSTPFDNRENGEEVRRSNMMLTRRQLSEQTRAPEIYIMKHYCIDYLKLSGKSMVQEHWNVVKNYLICYGIKDVGLMWNKYDRLFDLNFQSSAYFDNKDSNVRLSTMCFDFFNWFNLYMGNIKYEKRYEQYVEVE